MNHKVWGGSSNLLKDMGVDDNVIVAYELICLSGLQEYKDI